MGQATLLFVLNLLLCLRGISGVLSESCSSVQATTIPHLSERIVGYTLQGNDVPFSDDILDDGWYNLTTDYVISRSTKSCGTTYTWYLKDSLPTDDKKPQDLKVCRYENDDNPCADTETIQGLKCETGYLFKLVQMTAAGEGYCIEPANAGVTRAPAPDISITPEVVAGIVTNVKSEVEFYCKINPPVSTNYHYVIEWSLHTGLTLASSLIAHQPVLYASEHDFNTKTSLTEGHLRYHGIVHPGFTIGCSVKAQQHVGGYFSHPQSSPPKYFGLQVVNNTGTSVRVVDGDIAKLQFKLTIPFGCPLGDCFLDFKVIIPNKDVMSPGTECEIPRLNQIAHKNTRCGIKFTRDDVLRGTPKDFSITATFGKNQASDFNMVYDVVLSTNTLNRDHAFFQNYIGASIRVEFAVNPERLVDRICDSHSDPHIKTFDRKTYDNQREGTYIMYRHTVLPVEVQAQTAHCWNYDDPWRPWCNCGVAVRAGKDIFLIDRCGPVKVPASTVLCDDGVLKGKIRKENNVYTIYLPTGTIVEVTDIYNFFNIIIYPSLVDFGKTEGLCGSFDLNQENDIKRRTGYDNGDEISSWKANSTEDLFNRNNYGKLLRWREERYLCSCSADQQYNGQLTPQASCDTSAHIFCADDYKKTELTQHQCDLFLPAQRKKRSDKSNHLDISFDGYSDPRTAFYKGPKHNTNETSNKRHAVVKRSPKTYDNITAHIECLQLMNTTVFQMCSAIPDLDISNLIADCVSDALLSNSMDWTMSHLESIKQKCIKHVDVMQPLPPEVLAAISYDPLNNSSNSTNSTVTTLTSTPASTARPGKMPAISLELLTSLKSLSCPNECNGHGACKNGVCVCNDPFISYDCSVNKTEPPEMIGIPDKGICDLSRRVCATTSVIGNNFAESSSLKCSLLPFQIDRSGKITFQEKMETNGSFESLDEVYCQLPQPQTRSRRSTGALSDDYISRGYHVSVSNDGFGFSDSDSVVIFDSTCVNCHKEMDKIICSTKPNYCMKRGMCYTVGETEGCYSCLDTTPNHVGWVAGPDCAEPVIPEEEKKLWIIGAVLGPFAMFGVGLVAILCYIGKRKQKTRAKVGSLTNMQD